MSIGSQPVKLQHARVLLPQTYLFTLPRLFRVP